MEKTIVDTIEAASHELRRISLELYEHPEIGEHEYRACRLLTEYLEGKGFKVTREAAGMPTAFMAEYSNSAHGRRVGFCSEYDALPGIGQACGHELIAISGLACALATKALLEKDLIQGTVILYGTPAEESTSGKITFVQQGLVESRVDVAMMIHPGPGDGLYVNYLALDSVTVEYFGKASHAGQAPWDGINAVDAMMQAWDNVSMLRQQTLTTNRIHGIITNGGKSANVIPDYASCSFIARSLTKAQLAELKTKIENCLKAAAVATGCNIKIQWALKGPTDDVFQNEPLAETYKHYMEAQGIKFLPKSVEEGVAGGSTDMGNFSYVVPTIHPFFGIGTTAPNHTVEFAKATITEEAHKATLVAAECLAKTAASVFLDDQLYQQACAFFAKGKPQV
ncbi:aminoacylase 1-like protein 2 [Lichtheimia corymbifera JMRC:FSU:9682]|uniref:Peptidase M20 domain-containing protein 2 n=1 Tax=Lichtheimia corymbifera JMRC:FSU:9682 TaxID=1263082 RepID=A0A068RMH8_9FUNG|nr:aminoacylase 1-like protein 2 [Lichtheimia corymbifera JMRC:FSU:9682]